MNKLSLVGMQLPGIYKENFDVSNESPDEGSSLETSKFSLYFSGSCIPTYEILFKMGRRLLHKKRIFLHTAIFRYLNNAFL